MPAMRSPPPVAVVEAGRSFFNSLTALRLPWSYLTEAALYLARLRAAGVPVLTGITLDGQALVAQIKGPKGGLSLRADRIGLHDGIEPNDLGVPDCPAIPVVRIGDCREALGARAALADGLAGGARPADLLLGDRPTLDTPKVDRERDAERSLAQIYAHDGLKYLATQPAVTVLCRCENRSLADLRALGPDPTPRQLRLDGRFAMGACQGRFCAEWVGRLALPDHAPPMWIGANHWPAQPFAIGDLVDAPEDV